MESIGIIGVGNIGSIFARRVQSLFKRINMYEKDESKITEFIDSNSKFQRLSSISEIVEKSEYIVLGIKPQVLKKEIEKFTSHDYKDKVVITPVAGVKKEYYQKNFENLENLARIMPNIINNLGKGAIGVTYSESIEKRIKENVEKILSKLGKVEEIEEYKFNAFTVLNGSSPAFFYNILESFINAGIRMGLSKDESKRISVEVIKGAIELMEKENLHPAELKEMVSSPGGITIEGISSMEEDAVKGNIMKAFYNSYIKSKEMGE